MFFPELITGTILIVTGFLVKIFPDLIAGHNTLSSEQKKKVNIKGLSSMMKHYLIILGILVIIIGLVTSLIEMKQHYSILITSFLIILGVVLMISKSQKFYKP
jgi:uncharacterized membrane protein